MNRIWLAQDGQVAGSCEHCINHSDCIIGEELGAMQRAILGNPRGMTPFCTQRLESLVGIRAGLGVMVNSNATGNVKETKHLCQTVVLRDSCNEYTRDETVPRLSFCAEWLKRYRHVIIRTQYWKLICATLQILQYCRLQVTGRQFVDRFVSYGNGWYWIRDLLNDGPLISKYDYKVTWTSHWRWE